MALAREKEKGGQILPLAKSRLKARVYLFLAALPKRERTCLDLLGRTGAERGSGWYVESSSLMGRSVPMTREEVLQILAEHREELHDRFGVESLAVFGSLVRGEDTPQSDIDVLVWFDGPATSKRYFGVQFYLEDLLGRPVDLVTDKALRPELRSYIEREAIHA
jgi:hypothetical protein